MSEHPLGRAIVRCYKQAQQKELSKSYDFRMMPGEGVSAVVNGHCVLAGNMKLISANGEAALTKEMADAVGKHIQDGSTVIYIHIDGETAGYIALADTVRKRRHDRLHQINRCTACPTDR